MKRALSLSLLLALLFSTALAAEKATVLFVEAGAGISENERRVIEETLIAALKESGAGRALESTGAAIPGSVEERTALTRERGGEAWLGVRAARQGGLLALKADLYEAGAGRLLLSRELKAGSTVMSLGGRFWRPFMDEVRQAYSLPAAAPAPAAPAPIAPAEPAGQPLVEVTILAAPGSQINGLGNPAFADVGGRVTVQVPDRSSYRLRATHPDFLPDSREIFVEGQPLTVELSQRPAQKLDLEIFGNISNSIGLGALYYFLPGSLFAHLRLEQSFLYFMPGYWIGGSENWFDNCFTIRLGAGGYLNGQDAAVRVALETGGFLRYFAWPDTDFELHPLFPYGVHLTATFELWPGWPFRFFLEWAPELCFSTSDYAKEDYFYNDSPYQDLREDPYEGMIGISDSVKLNLFVLRLGLRYAW